MKEVKRCSISGVAFTLDEDAYTALEAYIASLKESYGATPDGDEIIADIEARVAELLLTRQENTTVIERRTIEAVIAQLGTAEAIHDEAEPDAAAGAAPAAQPRIPRRLYRDTEQARLGGVCSGLGRYFGVDPVWIRLGLFAPLLLNALSYVLHAGWLHDIAMQAMGIVGLGYLLLWFVVPAARSARQRLEMTGEPITTRSIGETTQQNRDIDNTAKPIVAETVSLFGRILLFFMKLWIGAILLGLVLLACALALGIFALIISEAGIIPIWGVIAALWGTSFFIYLCVCLIGSRKPKGTIMAGLLVGCLASIMVCAGLAIKEHYASDPIDTYVNQLDRIFATPSDDGDEASESDSEAGRTDADAAANEADTLRYSTLLQL